MSDIPEDLADRPYEYVPKNKWLRYNDRNAKMAEERWKDEEFKEQVVAKQRSTQSKNVAERKKKQREESTGEYFANDPVGIALKEEEDAGKEKGPARGKRKGKTYEELFGKEEAERRKEAMRKASRERQEALRKEREGERSVAD